MATGRSLGSPVFSPTLGCCSFASANISIPAVPEFGPVAIAALVGLLLGVARYRLGLGVNSAA